MSTTVFAKEFYRQALFLSGWHLEKLPDGGLIYSTPPFGEFWSNRNVQPFVDEQGKINFVIYSFFDRLKQALSLTPDQNLMATHRRLKELEMHIQDPTSPDLQRLKEEIHQVGFLSASRLKRNLQQLNTAFEKANEKCLLTTALIKISDLIGSFFHWQRIESYDFSPLRLEHFKEKAISPALELTVQDPLRCRYSPFLQNHSPFPLPPQLTRENLQRLELGLLAEIRFTLDRKQFCLWFDEREKEFELEYLCDESNPPPGSSQTEPYTWSAPLLHVTEKKIDGSTTTHPIQRIIQYSIQKSWTEDKWSCAISGGALRLNMNSEYTIPLSQGNFCIQPFQRY